VFLILQTEKPKADPVVQIGDIKVVMQDKGKEPMVFGKSVNSLAQQPAMANDHEASGRKVADKYHQLRWCPPGLTHTQKRKLQCLRNKEKKQQEEEKMRDEHFNRYRPMIPQGRTWQAKATQPAEPVRLGTPTGQTANADRSDCPEQPVGPVLPSDQPMTESVAPASVSSEQDPLVQEDEELVDYEASPGHTNMEINVVHLSSDYFVVPEEEMAHLQFGPRDAVFQKPKESDNHHKALYMRGHINGKPISRICLWMVGLL